MIKSNVVNLKGRDHSEDLGIDGMIKHYQNSGKLGGKMWTGFIWLRLRICGVPMRTRQWTLGFHKRQGISRLAEWLSASQEGIWCAELFLSTYS